MQCHECNVMNAMSWMQYDQMQFDECNLINAMCWMHCAEYDAMIAH